MAFVTPTTLFPSTRPLNSSQLLSFSKTTILSPLSSHRHVNNSMKMTTLPSWNKNKDSKSSPMSRRSFLISGLCVSMLSPSVVHADHTAAAARVSFDRYHPRIVEAVGTIRDIGGAIDKGDIASASALVNDKLFYVKGRRAFDIYAGTFSDNYVTQTTRDMKRDTDVMFSELGLAAKGGEEMQMHFQKALTKLNHYYQTARLPMSELTGLRVELLEE